MKKMKRQLIYITLIAVLVLPVLYMSGCGNDSGSDPSSAKSGQSEGNDMTDFSTVTLDGDEVDQTIFAESEITMINFWATFCGPCIDEMPNLAEIYNERKDSGLNIVGIVLDAQNSDLTVQKKKVDEALGIIKETEADYEHLLLSSDIVTEMIQVYSIQNIPTTVFVDNKGKVISEPYVGSRSKSEWKNIIDSVSDN